MKRKLTPLCTRAYIRLILLQPFPKEPEDNIYKFWFSLFRIKKEYCSNLLTEIFLQVYIEFTKGNPFLTHNKDKYVHPFRCCMCMENQLSKQN